MIINKMASTEEQLLQDLVPGSSMLQELGRYFWGAMPLQQLAWRYAPQGHWENGRWIPDPPSYQEAIQPFNPKINVKGPNVQGINPPGYDDSSSSGDSSSWVDPTKPPHTDKPTKPPKKHRRRTKYTSKPTSSKRYRRPRAGFSVRRMPGSPFLRPGRKMRRKRTF